MIHWDNEKLDNGKNAKVIDNQLTDVINKFSRVIVIYFVSSAYQ
jgi:hypothetical protein